MLEHFEHVMQGVSQSQVPASGLPIQQLAWNSPKRSSDQLLLACRTSHWLCIYAAGRAPDPSPGRCIPKQPNCMALRQLSSTKPFHAQEGSKALLLPPSCPTEAFISAWHESPQHSCLDQTARVQ